jgi:hypothetical protein
MWMLESCSAVLSDRGGLVGKCHPSAMALQSYRCFIVFLTLPIEISRPGVGSNGSQRTKNR